MKISEMTTDQAADVLVKIAEPASNIMHDEKVYKMLESMANTKDVSPIRFIADNLTPVTASLLKDHRADVYGIVAALAQKSVKEVEGQKLTDTIRDIKESLDGDLVDFFGSLK